MGWRKMNKPGPPALRRSGNGGRHSACGGGEKGWRPQREEKREEDALGRKRKERDKVAFSTENPILQRNVQRKTQKTLLGFYSKISNHRCRNFMREIQYLCFGCHRCSSQLSSTGPQDLLLVSLAPTTQKEWFRGYGRE
jgi:hypothetical protein